MLTSSLLVPLRLWLHLLLPAPAPELDLRVRYMYYACAPCTDNYRVESSATGQGRQLVGQDVTIRYRGKLLEETSAFPAAVTPGQAHFRIRGQLRPRSLPEWLFSAARTVEASQVQWLR